jgi:site-specific DNA recombinase
MPYCVAASPEVWDYYSGLGCKMADEREVWDGSHGVMIYGRSTEKNKRHQVQPHSEWVVCMGLHEPFISPEKWLAVQERFQQNVFSKKKKYPTPLLKGALRCAKCGSLMQVSRKKLAHGRVCSSYYCLKRSRQGVDACDMGSVKCETLDEHVLDVFREIEADPALISQYASEGQPSDCSALLRDLEKKASGIRSRISRLTESLADGSAASKYIVAQIETEDLSLAAVNREIEIAKADQRRSERAGQSAAGRSAEISRLVRSLDGLSAEDKNEIVRSVVSECTWDGSTLFLRL